MGDWGRPSLVFEIHIQILLWQFLKERKYQGCSGTLIFLKELKGQTVLLEKVSQELDRRLSGWIT